MHSFALIISAFVATTASFASPLQTRAPPLDGRCIALTDAALAQAKSEIYKANIVPDVYENGFEPKTTVALYYNKDFVNYGENLPMTETLLRPDVYFPKPKHDAKGTKYTLIMNDPDVPLNIANPTFLHWIRRGLSPNCESPASASGKDVRFYVPPTPPPLLAPEMHRYTFSILREPAEGYSPSALKYLLELVTFDINEYEKNTGAKLIGSTYFLGSAM